MLLEVYSSIMQTSNKKLCFIFIKNLMWFQLTNAFFFPTHLMFHRTDNLSGKQKIETPTTPFLMVMFSSLLLFSATIAWEDH